jgi:hypothetical protein
MGPVEAWDTFRAVFFSFYLCVGWVAALAMALGICANQDSLHVRVRMPRLLLLHLALALLVLTVVCLREVLSATSGALPCIVSDVTTFTSVYLVFWTHNVRTLRLLLVFNVAKPASKEEVSRSPLNSNR